MTKEKDGGFIMIAREAGPGLRKLAVGMTIDEVKKNFSEKQVLPENSPGNRTPKILINPLEEKLASIIMNFLATDRSNNELITMLTSIPSQYLRTVYEKEIVDAAIKTRTPVEETSNGQIYSLDSKFLPKFAEGFTKFSSAVNGLQRLPSAVLMGIVATFDSAIADTARDFYNLKPELFRSGSKTVLISEALQADSIAVLREKIISEEMYKFSRGSHEEQVMYFEDNFHVEIRAHWKRWPDFIEVFERRNLVAHGETSFTDRYVNICKSSGHKGSQEQLGLKIQVTKDYLRQSVDLLTEFGVLNAFSIWRKQFPSAEESAFQLINSLAFNFIVEKRYLLANRILDYVINLKTKGLKAHTRQMLVVNSASSHRHLADDKQYLSILDTIDWSGSGDLFQLCVAALKSDVNAFIEILPRAARAEVITRDDIANWPVFDFLRDEKLFTDACETVFTNHEPAVTMINAVTIKPVAKRSKSQVARSNAET